MTILTESFFVQSYRMQLKNDYISVILEIIFYITEYFILLTYTSIKMLNIKV